jgi:hypothetical protein
VVRTPLLCSALLGLCVHAFFLSLADGALLAGASAAHAFGYRFPFRLSGQCFGLRHCMVSTLQRLTCLENNGPMIAPEMSQIINHVQQQPTATSTIILFRCQIKRGDKASAKIATELRCDRGQLTILWGVPIIWITLTISTISTVRYLLCFCVEILITE